MNKTPPHSICTNCPEKFADMAAAREHGITTLDAAPRDEHGNAQGHTTRVVNPTPAEAEQSRIKSAIHREIQDVTDRLCSALDRLVHRGDITATQVRDELQGTDFEDAWDEYTS